MSRQGNQHIGASRDRQHETEVGAAEQGQIGDHPQRQDQDARHRPWIRERARIIQRRCGNNFATWRIPWLRETLPTTLLAITTNVSNCVLRTSLEVAEFIADLGCANSISGVLEKHNLRAVIFTLGYARPIGMENASRGRDRRLPQIWRRIRRSGTGGPRAEYPAWR